MAAPPPLLDPSDAATALARALEQHRRWFVLTGAGCSTGSGIPAYRDDDGRWQHSAPMQWRQFATDGAARQRYWARSRRGWPTIAHARPCPAHWALAGLEQHGSLELLVTQNVDGLHQRAGSRAVLELHGSLAWVRCLSCDQRVTREAVQSRLEEKDATAAEEHPARAVAARPDGDVDLSAAEIAGALVPDCSRCGGVLKPDVVFFGETVPPERVVHAYAALERADAVLVVGSSLTVFSGYRFVKRAHSSGMPIVLLGRGLTRADALAWRILRADCSEVLSATCQRLGLDSLTSG